MPATLMNEYPAVTTAAALRHRGIVDKSVDDAHLACDAVLAVPEAQPPLVALNQALQARTWSTPAVAGNRPAKTGAA
ncbi:MAG: hypothetical protein KGL40_12920 [Rhodocyclaceae bacterium]|nr:hypothetical protein [Rhodocyclaceae bacterium]